VGKLQNYEWKNEKIRKGFEQLRREHPERLQRRIDLSFCTLMFGLEDVTKSINRLASLDYCYIEILGNYGGYNTGNQSQLKNIKSLLEATGMQCSGICGSVQAGFTLESKDFFARQRAKDFIRYNVDFCTELGGQYYLLTPGSTGGEKPAQDGGDWVRSVCTLREIADVFTERQVKCAIEPILPSITPICHNFAEAEQYILEVNHPGVQHIYGDTEHMLGGEEHIGQAILGAGSRLLNLHLKDTYKQGPIGCGMLDIDTIIRALYLIGFNAEGHFAVGEPLTDLYDPMLDYGTMVPHSEEVLVRIAKETFKTFRERESFILETPDFHC
jgi:sugar phosphate isomerase/epimerase